MGINLGGRDGAALKRKCEWVSPWDCGRAGKNMVAGPENWLWESHGGENKASVLFNPLVLLLGSSPRKTIPRKPCLTP